MCRGTYPLTPPLPFTLGPGGDGHGHRASATASTSRSARAIMCVTAFWIGHGSFAEECLVAADSAFPDPRRAHRCRGRRASGSRTSPRGSGSSIAAASRAGDWLAVLGAAGGSGIAAVQLGRALGAHVIAVVSDDERAAFCRELGADATINHRDGPLAPRVARRHRRPRRRPDLRPRRRRARRGRGRRAGALRPPARGRVRERQLAEDRRARSRRHEHLARRRVRRRLQSPDELDAIHARARRARRRRPPAQRGARRGAVRRAARRPCNAWPTAPSSASW